MFQAQSPNTERLYRLAVIGLLLLSAAALPVTIFVMVALFQEQAIVEGLIRDLPLDAKGAAEGLAGKLRWQFRLTILIVLNVAVTAIAVALLWRAYHLSQESLRDVKALAGDILSSMDQAVITMDLDGIVTSINRRGREMLMPQTECIGRPLTELSAVVPLSELRLDWKVEKFITFARNFSAKSGGCDRVLRAFCQSLSDTNGNKIGFVLLLRDVTERFLIEERMRRMERYMGLGSLAAGLQHEIKNPLAALSLHVQLLEEQLEEESASDGARPMLGVIKTEVARIGDVLEGFRDFASVLKLNLAPMNLRDLIHHQIDLIAPQAAAHAVEIHLRIAEDLPAYVLADRVRLEQVLLNLLVNAMEAMPGGGKIIVSAFADEKSVHIEVSDTGHGVAEDLRDRIFDPYFTTKSEGTGLGLPLCDKIMRQHNGGLDCLTSPLGTTFQLILPNTTSADGLE